MALWFSANLKDGTSTLPELDEASEMAGIDPTLHNLPLITGLKFPRNTARWLVENMTTGRFKRDLQRAFQLDCQQEIYEAAARTLACQLFDLLSADVRISIA
jgi:hypothetical protein